MAKAHETEHTAQRTLTPEEQARRKATLEGGDPLKSPKPGAQTAAYGGPVDGYERRLERAAVAVPPSAVDYDRDGYPDSFAGRSGRNYNQRREHANFRSGVAGQSIISVPGQRDANFGRASELGRDGYRQDQIGYRDRFRVRVAAAAHLEEGEGEEAGQVDNRLVSLAQKGVPSHASTGVPGGIPPAPPFQSGQGRLPTVQATKTTPVQQAIMAPRTPATGFENTGAQLLANKGPALTESGGIPGPAGTTRHASFGSVPPQGTIDPETGAFVVGTPSVPEEPPAGKAKAAEHAKPHEPAKPHEHPKQPEHHGKK